MTEKKQNLKDNNFDEMEIPTVSIKFKMKQKQIFSTN